MTAAGGGCATTLGRCPDPPAAADGSAVGVGGGETGDGSEDELLRPLLVLPAATDEDGDELIEEVDALLDEEQSDPHREPDSRR